MTDPAKQPHESHNTFDERSILVAVTGGIAAYKVCAVVSRLAQSGADVTVVMTPAAQRFVGAATFQALSANPVYTDPWTGADPADPQHINLAGRADAALVAPCTANTLARLAAGFTDDIVTLVLSAIDPRKKPVLLAPSMNEDMWRRPATQRSLETLRGDGFRFVGPDDGWQACRAVGPGRMAEPDALLAALADALTP